MASKRRIRRRTCERKVRHACLKHALIAVRKSREKFGDVSGKLTPYHCRFCGGYHIGHLRYSI